MLTDATDIRTVGHMDIWTDTPSYRDLRTHRKRLMTNVNAGIDHTVKRRGR